jgi:hypothetical protein
VHFVTPKDQALEMPLRGFKTPETEEVMFCNKYLAIHVKQYPEIHVGFNDSH